MLSRRVFVSALVGILLGVGAGYLYRVWRTPALADRAKDMAAELRKGSDATKTPK